MKEESFDVVVIGGGPAGSSTATVLADHGQKVLLLDRERFPRFRIGESLLPAGWELWERLGVVDDLAQAGFVVKQGINFGMFGSQDDVVLLTAEYPDYFKRPWTYHVERARFDEILLKNAKRKGVEVREEWSVGDVLFEGRQAIGVMAGPNRGATHPIFARVVVDGSGRDALIARKLGWRRPDPILNKIAHFTHFEGAFRRDPHDVVKFGEVIDGSAMTDIHTIDNGWIWYIPLANNIVSVGVVLDAKLAGHIKGGPQARFDFSVQSSSKISEWIRGARQIMDMHTISNISYLNDNFVGDGFLLVGDAAMFIDPVFSAGVTIAIRGGIYAAEAIISGFSDNDFSAKKLKVYEDKIRYPSERIFKMIYNWYEILASKDPNNIISRARRIPLLRERFIVLLSGGYDKMDIERILTAAGETD